MEEAKKQLTDLLWKYADKVHSAGSCGELGDSFQALDSDVFSDVADEILQDFEPKKCMPDNINTKEEHEEYLKAIGYEKYVKDLEHHKDTTIGLYAFDKKLDKVFEWMPDVNGCKTSVEAYLVEQIEYLKSIVFQIK
jgi:hypothetical protein